LSFHGDKSYANAPQCNVVHTLSFLLILNLVVCKVTAKLYMVYNIFRDPKSSSDYIQLNIGYRLLNCTGGKAAILA